LLESSNNWFAFFSRVLLSEYFQSR